MPSSGLPVRADIRRSGWIVRQVRHADISFLTNKPSLRREPLSVFRSKLAKEAAVIRPHPLFGQATFVIKPEDI
jgi:hypothetical protein